MNKQMITNLAGADFTPVVLNGQNDNLQLKSENGQVVVSSRVVAERFGKQHKHVLDSVVALQVEISTAKNSALFIKSEYKASNGKTNPEYLLTRDGFTLLAMGFTGKEALHWKLKYIEAFNKMEQAISTQKPTCIEDVLIQSLQEMKDIKNQINQISTVATYAREEIGAMKQVMLLDHDSWREETTNLVNKIAIHKGGTSNIYQETRREAYELTEQRAGANLSQRVTNMQDRMRREGAAKSKVDKVSKLDVISADKRLKEIYIAVIKEMAVKYGIGGDLNE